MVQFETDHITASRALAGLTLFGAGVSVCGTKSGTVVIAADDAFADKLRELIGIEEPKKFRVFLAVASFNGFERNIEAKRKLHSPGESEAERWSGALVVPKSEEQIDATMPWSHYPWVQTVVARTHQEAVEQVYFEMVSRSLVASDTGWIKVKQEEGYAAFPAICREVFVLVQKIEGDKEEVVFKSDPLAGKSFDPNSPKYMDPVMFWGRHTKLPEDQAAAVLGDRNIEDARTIAALASGGRIRFIDKRGKEPTSSVDEQENLERKRSPIGT